MTAILMYGDSIRSLYLRHALPLRMFDPIVYLDNGETPLVVAHAMEMTGFPTIRGFNLFRVMTLVTMDLGSRLTEAEAALTVLQRACTTAGVTAVRVPPDFHLRLQEHSRAST